MKPFSERNPIVIAIVGLVSLIVIGTATFYSDDLPLIGGGTGYAADFADAGGLKAGDDVRVAGVKVGAVDSIALSGHHVQVDFKVKDAWIGNETTAAIKIKTLLGQEYIDLVPLGTHALDPDNAIPTSRTSTPIDVTAALSGLSNTVGRIDTTQLAQSFDTLSAAFKDTPTSVRSALTGLSRLSTTIASRDTQLKQLASSTRVLTGTLSRSDTRFGKLLDDGALLLQELQARSQAITGLLTGTRDLARQLSGLVRDNNASLAPALRQLSRVTDILQHNKGNLDQALHLIGPYYSLLNNAAGNGPWIDIYICGLFNSANAPILDATAKRSCSPVAGSSK